MKRTELIFIVLFLVLIAGNVPAYSQNNCFGCVFCDLCNKFYLTHNARSLVLPVKGYEDFPACFYEKTESPGVALCQEKIAVNKEKIVKIQELEESFLMGEMNTKEFAFKGDRRGNCDRIQSVDTFGRH